MTAELVTAADTSMLPDAARIPSGAKPALMYLGELHTEYSKRTMRSALNIFARWGGAESLLDVEWSKLTPVAVSSFMRQQLSAGKSAVSVNLYLCALKGVAKAAWQLELLNHDALDRIRSIKQVRVSRLPVGRSLSYAESAALLSAATGDDPQKIRDRAILTLFLGCGLRRAEICSLQMDKVDLFNGTIRLIGKGNKERKAFLTPDMQKTVAAWLDVRTEVPGYLFGNFTVSRRLRLDRPLNPSSLSRILKNLMGHASITTTSLYDRRGDEVMRRVAEMVEL